MSPSGRRPGFARPPELNRTANVHFRLLRDEYAQLVAAAEASGRTLSDWCRASLLAAAVESRKAQQRLPLEYPTPTGSTGGAP